MKKRCETKNESSPRVYVYVLYFFLLACHYVCICVCAGNKNVRWNQANIEVAEKNYHVFGAAVLSSPTPEKSVLRIVGDASCEMNDRRKKKQVGSG